MLAWFEGPGAGEEEGYAEGVTWQGFDLGLGAFAANVAVD